MAADIDAGIGIQANVQRTVRRPSPAALTICTTKSHPWSSSLKTFKTFVVPSLQLGFVPFQLLLCPT